ncbi:hypothetical protein BKA62DRAFT_641232 [Auriculariales sp. MPI-PUGE-AT-0066]|nr:hypothetical protein BKA62DRAFT_641232 [Auriculariales sp. MPI-PUGE-AT-0066]
MNPSGDRRSGSRAGALSSSDQHVRLPSFSEFVEGVPSTNVGAQSHFVPGPVPRQPYPPQGSQPALPVTPSLLQSDNSFRSSTPGPATQWRQSLPHVAPQPISQSRIHSPPPSLAYRPAPPATTTYAPSSAYQPTLGVSSHSHAPPQHISAAQSFSHHDLTTLAGGAVTIPYDPEPKQWNIQSDAVRSFNDLRDTSARPRYPYPILIRAAILSSPERKLKLQDIYTSIENKYPYFKTAGDGWKNSIRHNLSLVKTFQKVPRGQHEPGKGGYWVIHDEPAITTDDIAAQHLASSRPRVERLPGLPPLAVSTSTAPGFPSPPLSSGSSSHSLYPAHLRPQTPQTQALTTNIPHRVTSSYAMNAIPASLPQTGIPLPPPGISQQQWMDLHYSGASRSSRRASLPQPLPAAIHPPSHAALLSSSPSSPTARRSRAETTIHAYRTTRDPYYGGQGRGASRSLLVQAHRLPRFSSDMDHQTFTPGMPTTRPMRMLMNNRIQYPMQVLPIGRHRDSAPCASLTLITRL